MIKIKDTQFSVKNLKRKRKKDKKCFDLLEKGFEPQIFSNFPAHDLNFHGRSRSNLGKEVKISRL